MHIDIQLDLWVKGVSIHDAEAGGCVPDFSCCHPSLLADFGERVLFTYSFQTKRMDICQGMYLIFLSKLEPKLDVKGFYNA